MSIRRQFFSWLLFFFPVLVQAQPADSLQIRKIVNEIMVNGQAYQNLRDICRIGPRLSGSPQAEKAIELTRRMLQQAGADKVWLQPCLVTHWERGAGETAYLVDSAGTKFTLRISTLGNSMGTDGKDVCGELLYINRFDQVDAMGEKMLRDKIVFFDLPMNPTHIRTFQAYGESGIARRNGPSLAAKYGARAVLVRSLASNVDAYPHTGATRYNDSFPKIPAMALSTQDAEWIAENMAKGKKFTACLRNRAVMKGEVLSYNVIGEIKGSVYPEEIISIGGHLDSWDLGEGAHDDGAGCVQSIEALRALHNLGIRPKRTIRAVMFMNEENGGGGARAYLDSAIAKGEKHVFAIESDAGGFSPRGFSFDMGDQAFAQTKKWAHLFAEYGIHEWERGGSGADIGPLKKIGTALCGLRPDSQRYFDVHHAETDVFSAVSKRELDLGAAAMTALIWLVSEYGLTLQ